MRILEIYFLKKIFQVGDFESVVHIYVEAQEWKEAFNLVEKNPEYKVQQ